MITGKICIPVMRNGEFHQNVIFNDMHEYMDTLVHKLTAVYHELGTNLREHYCDSENQFGAMCLVNDAMHFACSVEMYLAHCGNPYAWKHYGFVMQRGASSDPFDHGPDPFDTIVTMPPVRSVKQLIEMLSDVQPVVAVNTGSSGANVSPSLVLMNSTTPAREEYTVLLPFMETRAGRMFHKTIEILLSQHSALLERIDIEVVDEEESDA